MFPLKHFFVGATQSLFRATQVFLVALGLVTVTAALPTMHNDASVADAKAAPVMLDAMAGTADTATPATDITVATDNADANAAADDDQPLTARLVAASQRIAQLVAQLRPIGQASANEAPVSELPTADDNALALAGGNPPAVPASSAPDVDRLSAYLARRYSVSERVVASLVTTAQSVGREVGVDPLLIVAVMAVESSFNPLAESNAGAQGLMQVMPRFHLDKVGPNADELSLFDARTNIRVGSMVLRETIRRTGSIDAGLQSYNGAPNDPLARYAGKVLSVRQRLAGVLHG